MKAETRLQVGSHIANGSTLLCNSCSVVNSWEVHTHTDELSHVGKEGEHALLANALLNTANKMLFLPLLFPHTRNTQLLKFLMTSLTLTIPVSETFLDESS